MRPVGPDEITTAARFDERVWPDRFVLLLDADGGYFVFDLIHDERVFDTATADEAAAAWRATIFAAGASREAWNARCGRAAAWTARRARRAPHPGRARPIARPA